MTDKIPPKIHRLAKALIDINEETRDLGLVDPQLCSGNIQCTREFFKEHKIVPDKIRDRGMADLTYPYPYEAQYTENGITYFCLLHYSMVNRDEEGNLLMKGEQ